MGASDAEKLHELFTEQQKVESQLDTDMNRWAELDKRTEI